MDPEQLKKDCNLVLDVIKDYWKDLLNKSFPVLPDFQTITPGYLQDVLPNEAPEEGENIALILDDYKKFILPGVLHWQHPDFHGYFPTACSTPSILGDLLADSVGALSFSWLACPSATELEVIVLNWLAKALGLPKKFVYHSGQNETGCRGGGIIECSASVASLNIAIALRNRAAKQNYQTMAVTEEDLRYGRGPGAIADRSVVYLSDQVNSSVLRAVELALLQPRVIKSKLIGHRLVMKVEDIQDAIEADREKGFIPLFCIATLGTTNTCEFDDLEEIGPLCQKENIWLHVDAAYAGSALLCTEFRHLFRGLEFADSFCFNPHKMLLVHFDCSILWVSDQSMLTDTFTIDAVYLGGPYTGMPEFKNWSVNLGRKNRALKLWMVLRNCGLEKIRMLMRKHHQLANVFAHLIESDTRFQLVNDVRLGLVCFSLKTGNKANKELFRMLRHERQLFLTSGSLPTHIGEKDASEFLRFVSNHQATLEDIERAVRIITNTATRVLQQSPK